MKLFMLGLCIISLVILSREENKVYAGNKEKEEEILDVIVVGAGVSGLTAASELLKKGKRVAIVEARDRIGGRVHSVKVGNVTLDLGGQWLHGEMKKHFLFSSAQTLNAPLVRSYFDGIITKSDGSILSESDIVKMYAEWEKVTTLLARKYQEIGNRDRPLSVGINLAVAELRKSKQIKFLTDAMVNFLVATEIISDYNGKVEDQSLWWFDSDSGAAYGKFEDSFVPNGMMQLVKHKFSNVWSANETSQILYLNHVVKGITQTKQRCEISAQHKNSIVSISAKFCIVTIPIGVLQSPEHSPKFFPALSSKFTKALNMRGMGRSEKVILEYEKSFWGDSSREAIFYLSETGSGPFNEFVNADFYLKHATNSTKKHYIIAFLATPFVEEYKSKPENEIIASLVVQLKKMFPNATIGNPSNAFLSDWVNDPFSLGAYSFNRVGIKPSVAFKDIQQHGSRVYFAGEHCSSRMWSSLNGAHDSGLQTTLKVLKRL